MRAEQNREGFTAGWHLDKRVSISHLITTISIAGAVLVAFFSLEGRVTVTEVRVEAMQTGTLVLRADMKSGFDAVIRKLESIEARQYEAAKQ